MAEFAARWQDDYLWLQSQLGRNKESTVVSYRNMSAPHILPFFGNVQRAYQRPWPCPVGGDMGKVPGGNGDGFMISSGPGFGMGGQSAHPGLR